MAHYKKREQAQEKAEEAQGSRITPRQEQVLNLLAEGKSPKEIGGILDISSRTVEFHKYRLMEVLGVGSVAELAVISAKGTYLKVEADPKQEPLAEILVKIRQRVLDTLSIAPRKYQKSVDKVFQDELARITNPTSTIKNEASVVEQPTHTAVAVASAA